MRPKAESKLLMGLGKDWWQKHENGTTHILRLCGDYNIEIRNYRGPRSRMSVYVTDGAGTHSVLEAYHDVELIDLRKLVEDIMTRRNGIA